MIVFNSLHKKNILISNTEKLSNNLTYRIASKKRDEQLIYQNIHLIMLCDRENNLY